MSYKIVVDPTAEPVTYEQAAHHLRIDDDGDSPPAYDQDYIEGLITAAREHCEEYCQRAIALQTIEYRPGLYRDGQWFAHNYYPCRMEWLPRVDSKNFGEIISVTGADDAPFTTYRTDDPDQIYLYATDGTNFPNGPRITYTGGYTSNSGESPDSRPLPKSIRSAMYLLIANWYENREPVSSVQMYELPMGVKTLLQPYRFRGGV